MNREWTWRHEVIQRVATSWEFIRFAWVCLWVDSSRFSAEYMRATVMAAKAYERAKQRAENVIDI